MKKQFVLWFKRQSANQRKVLNRFFFGSFLFFVGLVVFTLTEFFMTDSLKREWVTLIALIAIGIGFCIAMMGYASMLYWRFWKHFK